MAREVGIVVSIKDSASASLRGIGGAFKGLAGAAKSVVNDIRQTFSLQNVITNVTALGRAGVEAFGRMKQAVGELLDASMKFRSADDPMVKWMQDMQLEGERVKARLGDVLLPVIKGISDALGAATGSMSKWIEENRKAISLKIVDVLEKVATWIVRGVAAGATLAARAWYGLNEVVLLVKWALLEAASVGANALASMLESVAAIADYLPGKMADTIRSGAQAVRDMAQWAEQAASDTVDSIANTADELDELTKRIDSFEVRALRVVGGAAEKARQNVDQIKAGGQQLRETTEKTNAARLKAEERYSTLLKAHLEDRAQYQLELSQRVEEEERARVQARRDIVVDGLTQMSEAYGQAFAGIMTGQMSVAQGFAEMAKSMVMTTVAMVNRTIMLYAAEAAAAEFRNAAVTSIIPGVGLLVGAAAATAMFTAVASYAVKMSGGGDVPGAAQGIDYVPALLAPGERVLSTREARAQRRAAERVGPAAMGGPSISISVESQTLAIGTRSERRKALKSLAREFDDLVRSRVMLRGLARA